jgi:hypothetical protein
MNWDLNDENQKKYDEVTTNIRRLQIEMGIEPRTLAERAEEYQKKKVSQVQITAQLGMVRPKPKWKI